MTLTPENAESQDTVGVPEIGLHVNLTATHLQGKLRFADLRRWLYLNNVSLTELGGHMGGISRAAVCKALKQDRIKVDHHKAIMKAYPAFPVELLPEPRDVPPGPRPKGLELQQATA